jgi:hypothetical protein
MFTRVKGGGWAAHEKLTSAQQNQLDIDHANAIDGAGGSAGTPYAPTTAIVVGGEGIDHVYLADLPTLKAIDTTSIADGAVRWVLNLGRFKLDKSVYPTFTEDLPLVVAPTTGTGRWFAQDAGAINQYVRTFTASGTVTWKCPPNLALILVELVGGGAGGGNGANTSSATDDAPGGGGGGSGLRFLGVVAPVGNTNHDVTVGAGGTANVGLGGGNDGRDSSIQVHLGVVLATAKGGQAGSGTLANAGAVLVPGGAAGGASLGSPTAILGTQTLWPVASLGAGGHTTNGVVAGQRGGSSPSYLGGAGGAKGTTATNKGGSGGGGGAAGFGGAGGAGGAGGNGTAGAAGAPQNGAVGTSAAANTGAGGGGSGGAGAAGSGSPTIASAGNGGSGWVTIRGYARFS